MRRLYILMVAVLVASILLALTMSSAGAKSGVTKRYGAMRSRDLVNWEDISDKMHFPDEGTPQRLRHGTVIAVPEQLINNLKAAK